MNHTLSDIDGNHGKGNEPDGEEPKGLDHEAQDGPDGRHW